MRFYSKFYSSKLFHFYNGAVRSTVYALLSGLVFVAVSGCNKTPPQEPGEPTPRPTPINIVDLIASECPPAADVAAIIRTCGTAPRPATLACVIAVCKGLQTPAPITPSPRPNPSKTSTSSPTAVPTVTPTTAPTVATTVAPPAIDVWRGCQQSNMDVSVAQDGSGRTLLFCDTTMLFWCPMVPPAHAPGGVGGARSCDPGHSVVFRDCCGSREWDDPRGPRFIVSNPAVEVRQPCTNGNPFNACFLAPRGTVTTIDTCPRSDVHSCVTASESGDHANDCPSGKIPLRPNQGTGCFGAREVRF